MYHSVIWCVCSVRIDPTSWIAKITLSVIQAYSSRGSPLVTDSVRLILPRSLATPITASDAPSCSCTSMMASNRSVRARCLFNASIAEADTAYATRRRMTSSSGVVRSPRQSQNIR